MQRIDTDAVAHGVGFHEERSEVRQKAWNEEGRLPRDEGIEGAVLDAVRVARLAGGIEDGCTGGYGNC